ncbi:MAG: DegT/DnrJ/EryC1/StrS family aminotransferase [Clostridia bacterium]|nr:DegT/DnrJ/EryC1/StrS family aminotransferase [Clostridia bacterium]
MKKLAILGGEPLFKGELPKDVQEMMKWPIITEEDENAALDVIRNNNFSRTDITEKFEKEFAEWLGVKHAVAYCNGTMSLAAAMFAIGLSKGDEIICPTKTYWASILPASSFGAVPVFCDINEMLSMDPDDIERVISKKTKAIVVVHYAGYPCDMDRIMAIAKKHGIKVIEDVSHAQGGLYKGKRLGTFGDIAAMSLMSTKSFAAGELGVVVTNNTRLYERALAYGHYDRNNDKYIKESEELFPYYHIALGAVKGRANQLCCAMARVQLKYYDERCAQIRKAMNYFWDLLEDLDAIKAIRVDESTGSNMAGFYAAMGIYYPEKLGGLSVKTFARAVKAELGSIGYHISTGGNLCLHLHNYFKTFDFNGCGVPSRIENADRDVRLLDDGIKNGQNINCFGVPWIKKYNKEWIEKIAMCFRRVIENYELLLPLDNADEKQGGRWHGFTNQE